MAIARKIGKNLDKDIIRLQTQLFKEYGVKLSYSQASDAYAKLNKTGSVSLLKTKNKITICR